MRKHINKLKKSYKTKPIKPRVIYVMINPREVTTIITPAHCNGLRLNSPAVNTTFCESDDLLLKLTLWHE